MSPIDQVDHFLTLGLNSLHFGIRHVVQLTVLFQAFEVYNLERVVKQSRLSLVRVTLPNFETRFFAKFLKSSLKCITWILMWSNNKRFP